MLYQLVSSALHYDILDFSRWHFFLWPSSLWQESDFSALSTRLVIPSLTTTLSLSSSVCKSWKILYGFETPDLYSAFFFQVLLDEFMNAANKERKRLKNIKFQSKWVSQKKGWGWAKGEILYLFCLPQLRYCKQTGVASGSTAGLARPLYLFQRTFCSGACSYLVLRLQCASPPESARLENRYYIHW